MEDYLYKDWEHVKQYHVAYVRIFVRKKSIKNLIGMINTKFRIIISKERKKVMELGLDTKGAWTLLRFIATKWKL